MAEPERLFTLASLLVVPGWLLLVVAPRWRWSARLVGPVILPMLLSALYIASIALHLPHVQGGFGSLAEVRLLFSEDWILLAGWIHYLAFDLFVGCWQVRDSQRLGISHFIVAPCLLLTFVAGPIGLLSYLLVRILRRRAEIEPLPEPSAVA